MGPSKAIIPFALLLLLLLEQIALARDLPALCPSSFSFEPGNLLERANGFPDSNPFSSVCKEYAESTCCGAQNEEYLIGVLKIIQTRMDSNAQRECDRLVNRLVCAPCSPSVGDYIPHNITTHHRQHWGDSGREESGGRSYRGIAICPKFCRRVWAACGEMVPYLLGEPHATEERFCGDLAQESDRCFGDDLVQEGPQGDGAMSVSESASQSGAKPEGMKLFGNQQQAEGYKEYLAEEANKRPEENFGPGEQQDEQLGDGAQASEGLAEGSQPGTSGETSYAEKAESVEAQPSNPADSLPLPDPTQQTLPSEQQPGLTEGERLQYGLGEQQDEQLGDGAQAGEDLGEGPQSPQDRSGETPNLPEPADQIAAQTGNTDKVLGASLVDQAKIFGDNSLNPIQQGLPLLDLTPENPPAEQNLTELGSPPQLAQAENPSEPSLPEKEESVSEQAQLFVPYIDPATLPPPPLSPPDNQPASSSVEQQEQLQGDGEVPNHTAETQLIPGDLALPADTVLPDRESQTQQVEQGEPLLPQPGAELDLGKEQDQQGDNLAEIQKDTEGPTEVEGVKDNSSTSGPQFSAEQQYQELEQEANPNQGVISEQDKYKEFAEEANKAVQAAQEQIEESKILPDDSPLGVQEVKNENLGGNEEVGKVSQPYAEKTQEAVLQPPKQEEKQEDTPTPKPKETEKEAEIGDGSHGILWKLILVCGILGFVVVRWRKPRRGISPAETGHHHKNRNE